MRFLILSTDYPDFLSWFYAQHPGLEEGPYEQQLRARMESLFGVADFYSSNLGRLGHQAWDVHANNEFMQKAWAREHGLQVDEANSARERMWALRQRLGPIAAKTPIWHLRPLWRPLLGCGNGSPAWFYNTLAAQIREYKPDILLNQSMDGISSHFLREMKSSLRLLVGQIAAPLPESQDFSEYDLIVSSLPNFVDHFRSMGLVAELNRLAFEPRILSNLKDGPRNIPVSFVGSVTRHHRARVQLLEYLCARQHVQVWGGEKGLPRDSSIRLSHMGHAWGREMYEVLRRSKITLNHHIEVAGPFANNSRVFEATGTGTLLITDWKKNLHEMFEAGKEVVTYRTPEECIELLSYYLNHDEERESIARAGQQRTLRDHTYYQRMGELVEIVRRYN